MICHVDMDAFFASVEELDNPSLAGKCVIVGGVSDRGVVAAAGYEARKYGVRSAMPVYQAKKLCPKAVFLPPRGKRYSQVSKTVMHVLDTFSPLVEQVSIDEAFLDLSGCEGLFGEYKKIGHEIKKKVRQEVGLTCSVGIAPLKFLAKIASDMDKPDGLYVIMPEDVKNIIETLPVSKVSGVGPVTGKTLAKMGIRYLGEAGRMPRDQLVSRLGKFGYRLYELSAGIDRGRVSSTRVVKSISSEETLAADTTDSAILERLMLKHAEDVGRQVRKKKFLAKTVFIKLKDNDFKQITRQSSLPEPTRSSEIIYRGALALLKDCRMHKPIRLAGLGVCDLVGEKTPQQQSLFEDARPDRVGASARKWEQIGGIVDAIEDRFGPNVIRKARLYEDEKDTNSEEI